MLFPLSGIGDGKGGGGGGDCGHDSLIKVEKENHVMGRLYRLKSA